MAFRDLGHGVAAVDQPRHQGEALEGEAGVVLADELSDEPAEEVVEALRIDAEGLVAGSAS